MTNLNELEARIKSVNGDIARLNKERETNLARKKVYEEEFNKNCAQYNEKYGTSVDLSNIDSEYDKVSKDFEAQVGKMEQVVALVKEGRVSEAEYILTGKTPEQVSAEKRAQEAAQAPQTEPVVAPQSAPTTQAEPQVAPQAVQPEPQVAQPAQPEPVVSPAPAPSAEPAETATPVEPASPFPTAPTVDLVGAAHASQGTPILNTAPQAPTAPQAQAPQAQAPTAPTPVFKEDDVMPKPVNPLFGGAPIGAPAPQKAPTVEVPKAPAEAPKVAIPEPKAEPDFKIPTPVGVPSQPFTGAAPDPVPMGAGAVTSDIGAFDQVLRQESEGTAFNESGNIPVPPKPPVGAIPVPPAFNVPTQGTENKSDVSGALNFGDILNGTNFGL